MADLSLVVDDHVEVLLRSREGGGPLPLVGHGKSEGEYEEPELRAVACSTEEYEEDDLEVSLLHVHCKQRAKTVVLEDDTAEVVLDKIFAIN